MPKRNKIKILLMLVVVPMSLMAATVWSWVEKGNKAYFSKNYGQALSCYEEAAKVDSIESIIPYNIACALYKKKIYDRALVKNDSANALADNNKEVQYKSLTNKGNAAFQKKDFETAVEAYKASLRLNPGDEKTKYNLALALHQLKNNPRQNDNKDKNKDAAGNDKQKEENQEEKNRDKNKDKEDKTTQQEKDKDESSDKNKPSPQNIDKDIKTQMLKMIDQQEKEVNRRLLQGDKSGASSTEGKDW